MHTRFLLLALLLALSPVVRAQHGTFNNPEPPPDADAKEVRATYIGLRFGVVAGQLHGRHVEADHSSKAGLTGGVVVGWRLFKCDGLWLEAGIRYVEKGAVLVGETYADGRNEPTPSKARLGMHYFEFPLLIKGRIPCAGFYLCPSFGVYGAIGFSGRTTYAQAQEAYNTFRAGGLQRGDWGLQIGLGLKWKMLYADMAYDIGLRDVATPSLPDFRYDPTRSRFRTGAFTFNVGLDF